MKYLNEENYQLECWADMTITTIVILVVSEIEVRCEVRDRL